MDTARQIIREALATAQSPAVMCSFGKDSMLVLALIRELRTDVPLIWFRTGFDDEFARRIIREWDLTAYSPSPSDVYLLVHDGNRALVHEYSFGGTRLPVITDLVLGHRCILTSYPKRTPVMVYPFDVVFTGYKDCDTHWLKGDTPMFDSSLHLDRAKLIAPIRHMTDYQVRSALHDLHVPYAADTDELPLCTHCMTGDTDEVYCPELKRFIPRTQWEADKSLTAFRERFRLEDTNGQNIH